MELLEKVAILADAAKYDASCASSGSVKKDSRNSKGVGSTSEGMGICHSYTPDGRCVSLLKILMTNMCIYDCLYCVNRHSSNVPRARFTVAELVELTLEFYKRNYIEGLFLSSGIIRNPDYTMEQMVAVARTLRQEHQFKGYIHLKTIPDADERLLAQAGLYADRLSINIELPTGEGLARLAPEKNRQAIHQSMSVLKNHIDEGKENRKQVLQLGNSAKRSPAISQRRQGRLRPYAPAGQSTQMIIGADDASDLTILQNTDQLYRGLGMRRVYYSAFSPIPDASSFLPLQSPPLVREHRLYQADWLLRFYQFDVSELLDVSQDGMLDLNVDPKMAWALRHREYFPLDINRASKSQLLRVPGLGTRNVQRILSTRRHRRLRFSDLQQMRLPMEKLKPFIVAADYIPAHDALTSKQLYARFSEAGAGNQMALF
ncbi:putative DNA modification/repair radical SAM protein [Spongiibacter sp. KMU-158]|uniref:DNA modification/repair radical SAM protein n=1 Tax=Spongiibacter pelagi TaxID=2760804 RepID=A0A927C0K4_9GAMM|nr:putative DNA modification/repair radical SAM protein [Spongiibacter pelagi]MBD2857652.1 putative DNA modification/repair radical SAM protein [Spongiibacter pelagi]